VHESVKFFIRKFRELLDRPTVSGSYFRPRPYRNAAVCFRGVACAIEDFDARYEMAERTGFNVFMFPSSMIPGCDLLSDSGTSTMTMTQWARLLQGDEAYGSNEGFYELKEQIADTFGPEFISRDPFHETLFLFHQGRAAEHALFSTLSHELAAAARELPPLREAPWLQELPPQVRESIEEASAGIERRIARRGVEGAARKVRFVIPSNAHFDTTQENIEDSLIVPLNLPCAEHVAKDETYPFRGNMDVEALAKLLDVAADHVPVVYLTITNNTGGGQPVSMENIRQVAKLAHSRGIPFMFDACRFAENAWFIREKEAGCREKSIMQIVREMFSHVDGFHISFKKDGLANMGGGLVIKKGGLVESRYPNLRDRLIDWQIMVEGHPSYGGLAGRDLKGIAEGLRTIVKKEYLDHRIGQVLLFGEKLSEYGIPIVRPVGGHAVYVDVDEFFDSGAGGRTWARGGEGAEEGAAAEEDFRGLSLTALLLVAGHRLCELGVYAFGRYDPEGGQEIPPSPRVNYVRAAVPRLAYEDQDLLAVAEALRVLRENRERIPAMRVVHGRELTLRHFKSRFAFEE